MISDSKFRPQEIAAGATLSVVLALAAYASYVVNALQFLLKFQAAKQTASSDADEPQALLGARGALES